MKHVAVACDVENLQDDQLTALPPSSRSSGMRKKIKMPYRLKAMFSSQEMTIVVFMEAEC